MLVIDIDVLIDVQRGHTAALNWFIGLGEVPSVPGLVVMELIQGARDARQVREAVRLTAALPMIWPTATDHQKALMDFTSFHLSHGLGLLDALIAACAVGLSAELCTFNAKHYRMVPGLITVQPYFR
jgi:predicted nucleic acid-binding protein